MAHLQRSSSILRVSLAQVDICGRQTFSCHFSVSSRLGRSMSAADAAAYLNDKFCGKTIARSQQIDANQLQRLALTLGQSKIGDVDVLEAPPPQGTPVPPGHHLVYFTPAALESDLGPDGTDRSFNAPGPFSRRMWAGGEMHWPVSGNDAARLRVGDEVEECTRLLSAVPKKSSSGDEMVLVNVEKTIEGRNGMALRDQRSWIFRPAVEPKCNSRSTASTAPTHNPHDVSKVSDQGLDAKGHLIRQYRWSAVGLFRFSALTFNGHKIHYNEEWAGHVESHPGLVVHGPLNLINMLDYWRDAHGMNGRRPRSIIYRATSPVYAGETYEILTGKTENTEIGLAWEILVKKRDNVCMRGIISA